MDSLYKRIVECQHSLSAEIGSERLPQAIISAVKELMNAENVMLVGIDETLIGPWAEKNGNWKIRQYSLDVIRKAMQSSFGYYIAGTLEENPSESQVAGNILSCIAAPVNAGDKTPAAIYCDFRSGRKRFTTDDGANLKTIAASFAAYFSFMESDRKRLTSEPAGQNRDLDSLLVGQSAAIRELRSEIRMLARVDTPVLILGETGTGKEVVARALHELSSRAAKEFVPVHCAAVNSGTFESDLFGHERGAFSGAYKKREGKILRSDGGSLFLDEVGDIPIEFQIKLLRVLETKRVSPVGSDLELQADFRLICATNRDLNTMISDKTFREDLHYRISDVRLKIPPLNDRLEDVPILARHFAAPKQLTSEASDLLAEVNNWPGNVRQLRKVVENARALEESDEISAEAIARQLKYQELQQPVRAAAAAETMNFQSLKQKWNDGAMRPAELESILNSLYVQSRKNWRRVGKQLGAETQEEIKTFRNWIYYLQKTKIIRPPAEQTAEE